MKKFYRLSLLIIVFILLSTYSPNKFNLISKTKNTFFEIKNVIIINNLLLKTSEVEEKLSKIYSRNIFLVKKSDIEAPLKKISFFKKIEVKKKYPNTIVIKIFETRPVAYIYKSKIKYLLDSSSNLISLENGIKHGQLPNIFGEGAENSFINFFNQLKSNNFPSDKIENFYYFQIGRWDLELVNNKIIKFPYNNIDEAIRKSIELLKRDDFKNYNTIDLRVDGKIIVE